MANKNNLSKCLLGFSIICLLFTSYQTIAQTWQWPNKGGATDALGDSAQREQVMSMCTDNQGNVYVTSKVGRINLQVAGNPKQTYASNGLNDAIVAAFTCDGQYKWSKVIGGYFGVGITMHVTADGIGNVYISGQVPPVFPNVSPAGHYDSDVTLPNSPSTVNTFKQTMFLIKYDSEGNYQWHRQPQPADVARTVTGSLRVMGLEADAQGNTYSLCVLHPGAYANGAYVVPVNGIHLLKYDTSGNFVSGVKLDMEATLGAYNFKMKRNHNTGQIYLAGRYLIDEFGTGGTISFGGQNITHSKYLASFESDGSLNWVKENESVVTWGGGVISYDVAIDSDNNIYFGGSTGRISTTNSAPDSFNGVPFTPFTQVPWPFIIKLNPAGETIWQTNGSYALINSITVNGNEISGAGAGNNFDWQNLHYQQDANSGGHPYIARFNKTTGEIIAINGLYTTGDDWATTLAADGNGSYYIGGQFSASMTAGTSTISSSGGVSDFFVAKFGTDDCDFMATNHFKKSGIKAYPNPTTDILYLSGIDNASYSLYNMLGMQVMSGTIAEEQSIFLGELASGVYMMRIKEGALEKMLKIIKN